MSSSHLLPRSWFRIYQTFVSVATPTQCMCHEDGDAPKSYESLWMAEERTVWLARTVNSMDHASRDDHHDIEFETLTLNRDEGTQGRAHYTSSSFSLARVTGSSAHVSSDPHASPHFTWFSWLLVTALYHLTHPRPSTCPPPVVEGERAYRLRVLLIMRAPNLRLAAPQLTVTFIEDGGVRGVVVVAIPWMRTRQSSLLSLETTADVSIGEPPRRLYLISFGNQVVMTALPPSSVRSALDVGLLSAVSACCKARQGNKRKKRCGYDDIDGNATPFLILPIQDQGPWIPLSIALAGIRITAAVPERPPSLYESIDLYPNENEGYYTGIVNTACPSALEGLAPVREPTVCGVPVSESKNQASGLQKRAMRNLWFDPTHDTRLDRLLRVLYSLS
ncbi:hypothetical protein BC826DRAFT_967902 [Russula brevipes]|nr:hypothetical protein BC826DRAFT_967902 [Russula brevipes]